MVSVVLVSAVVLIQRASFSFLAEIPTSGGSFTEGVVGSARFINPALALSPVDKDLVTLVYAGLLRPSSNGLRPALADSYAISEDGLTYSFSLRSDATFHDGTQVTAEDVAFTIELIQQEQLKSPQFVHWEDVSVEIEGMHTVHIILPEAYAPFIENMTLGIMPRHIWEGIDIDAIPFSDHNINPIGAGPFKIDRVRRDQGGIPHSFELERFDQFILGRPFLTSLTIQLFRNEEEAFAAYQSRLIDSLGSISPELLTDSVDTLFPDTFHAIPLPRTFAVFYNQNRMPLFTRSEVRETVELLTDRNEVINDALGGYGHPLTDPIPQNERSLETTESFDRDVRSAEAEELLNQRGWERSEEDGVWELVADDTTYRFAFELSTANTPELVRAAESLAQQWRAFGIDVTIVAVDTHELAQSVIRPRRFEALLFGSILGREPDLYAFWHSSQRTDPGLNVAQFTSISADALLEQARRSADSIQRNEAHQAFIEEFAEERPALFLYQPTYLYFAPRHIRNISLTQLTEGNERFGDIHTWYSQTRRIWSGVND